jgi:hypothetical protein
MQMKSLLIVKMSNKANIFKNQLPQFVGQTKPVGQYSLHSRAILAYNKNKWDKFCGKFCQFCWKYAI